MEPDAADGRQVSVQSLADQVVREAVATNGPRDGLHQPCMDRLADRVERILGAQVAHGAQKVNTELGSLCGSELESNRRWRLEVGDPAGDHGAHTRWHRNP